MLIVANEVSAMLSASEQLMDCCFGVNSIFSTLVVLMKTTWHRLGCAYIRQDRRWVYENNCKAFIDILTLSPNRLRGEPVL